MRTRRGGFTLVELLVAITILAFIAVLGWRGLDGIIRSRGALTATMEQTRGLQLAFAQMQSDCENLATSALLRNRANMQVEDNRITLVRMVLAENQPSRLQVVAYRVREGVLTRRESSATRDLLELDSLWQAALADTDPAVSVALQSGVQNMSMRYWMPGASATGSSGWRDGAGVSTSTVVSAAPAAPAATPTGMEVSLTLQGLEVPLVKSFLLGAI
ncbi:PulJ/GspJ family protein [Duganella aceris]|jgi:general secretion pathway protein J|uniref:Prepilin-type N-terminal cleavage/methylation domain-containing protein n=1 Tax=Duganella aceris TaxID=2703883 RepID=A0ABX0FT34_9BURK|nr:prepilin-type N-terminal cleavage/methylation domain-containing protein [Duganella aceris]NGZ87555.1 prepilin-type N-terminal cleavage/methylation domain-containing protein [Duganella aceris]